MTGSNLAGRCRVGVPARRCGRRGARSDSERVVVGVGDVVFFNVFEGDCRSAVSDMEPVVGYDDSFEGIAAVGHPPLGAKKMPVTLLPLQ